MDDGKANAISHRTIEDLDAALHEAEGARALVLAGRPGKFCAGFDLSVVKQGPGAAIEMMNRGAEIALRLHEWPTPRVIASTGHALAMGAVLLSCADVRIGAEGDFKYGLNEVAIGLALPEFAIELTRSRLTPTEFHQATVLSKIYSPDQALAAGYLDELVEPERVVDHALDRAAELAEYLDARAFAATRSNTDAELTEKLRKSVASAQS